MSDSDFNFHNFALRSMLFKGRTEWYVSYLKTERITQVLLVLSDTVSDPTLLECAQKSAKTIDDIVYCAAGETQLSIVLADLFSLISLLKVATSTQALDRETAEVLIHECEGIARRLGSGAHPSPFISTDDFIVPIEESSEPISAKFFISDSSHGIKDIQKGHTKDNLETRPLSKEQEERERLILDFVKAHNGVSIKQIAAVVRNCSEKTIQRELSHLISLGKVKKIGERRWSVYFAI